MADLDALLLANEAILKRKVSEKHRIEVAKRVGNAWESLATFIGVSNVEVNDIKEEYRNPLDRRLAMMRKWHELWGSEATYLRLMEGLKQIGRRDLIESLLHMAKVYYISQQQCWQNLPLWFVGLLGAAMSLMILASISRMVNFSVSDARYQTLGNNSITSQHFAENITTHPQTNKTLNLFNYRTLSNCSFPDNDLPIILPLFVGRENDMQQVLSKVVRTNILNINGAPGFGKSTLAIHVGYEIFKNGTSVRYINIEDKVYSMVNQGQKSDKDAMPDNVDNIYLQLRPRKSLVKLSRHPMSASKHQIHRSIESDENFFEELRKWSETIKCTSVLILDNCDDVLVSTSRDEFLSLINLLVIKSNFNLHIIIVSREKLLYLDSFDHWTVGELNQSASVELLDKIAPAIDNRNLTEVAELVEGCPLALKVIGQLLHIHGAQLIHKLKKEVMTTLDKASVPEQRFRVIMDVAFNRLGVLKYCGHALSLFPGSFDEAAGNAVVEKECLETYLKHSLVNEYSLAFNYRYKIHRLIKEYLREKISISENETFVTTFRKHFQSLLLTQVRRQISTLDTDKYVLSLELHNLHYLKELLLADDNNTHLSSEELAVLAMLLDIKLIQLKQIHRYYAIFMDKIEGVCSLLNVQLCGQLYTNIAGYLYQQCKCQTFTAYIQNFFNSPCMEYFKCPVVQHLLDLCMSGMLHLPEDELSYINLVAKAHCYERHCNWTKNGNTTELSNDSGHYNAKILIEGALVSLGIILIIRYSSSKSFMVLTITIIGILLYDEAYRIILVLINHITSVHHPTLRVLEIVSKFVCYYVVTLIILTCSDITIITIILLLLFVTAALEHSRYSRMLTIIFLVLLSILSIKLIVYYNNIIYVVGSIPPYCCQFIPVCM